MKRIMILLMAGWVLLPFSGLADGLLGNTAVSVQEYQSANSTDIPSSPVATVPVVTKESTARAALDSQAVARSVSTVSSSPPSSPTVIVSEEAARTLQAELTQMNSNNLAFQQQMDEKIVQLTSENQNLQNRIAQLAEAMTLLNREVAQLSPSTGQGTASTPLLQTGQTTTDNDASLWSYLKNYFGPIGFKIVIAAAGIILLSLLWTIWPTRKKKKKQSDNKDAAVDDTKDEYDYMGSVESIPAKLNLVRTYMAMEDYHAARKVLADILLSGDHQQKQEASEILNELPAES